MSYVITVGWIIGCAYNVNRTHWSSEFATSVWDGKCSAKIPRVLPCLPGQVRSVLPTKQDRGAPSSDCDIAFPICARPLLRPNALGSSIFTRKFFESRRTILPDIVYPSCLYLGVCTLNVYVRLVESENRCNALFNGRFKFGVRKKIMQAYDSWVGEDRKERMITSFLQAVWRDIESCFIRAVTHARTIGLCH